MAIVSEEQILKVLRQCMTSNGMVPICSTRMWKHAPSVNACGRNSKGRHRKDFCLIHTTIPQLRSML